MIEISSYMPVELGEDVTKRCEELEMSKSEYLRLLASLDISVQRYQQLVTYINLLYNRINETHQKLGIYATPIQVAPIIEMN